MPPAAQQEDWRRKYFDSIGAIEEEARQYRKQQGILYKLITRLCAAGQGQSPRIDSELRRLRDSVRREAGVEELEPFGEAIAEAVRAVEAEREESSAKEASYAETVPAFQPAAPAAAASAPTIEFVHTTQVVYAQQPRPSQSLQSALAAPPAPQAMAAGTGQLREVLLHLLAELRHEPEFANEIAALESEIGAPPTHEKVPALVAKVGGLLVQQIRNLEKARQGLAVLMEQMLGQLDSLNVYVKGQSEEESRRQSNSDALNLQITGEVRAMGESVESDCDIETLREQLGKRLQSISRHVQTFRDREKELSRQSRERAARMSARMDEMENEAKALQTKLRDEQRQSLLDPLTRIPNRLAWEQRITEELARAQRLRETTCVLAWDIDGFKAINDRYGHRAGDKVLVVVAESLATGIRGTDFAARYGGEEFVMLLPGTALARGIAIANNLRETIAQTGFHFRGAPVSVTISCGITELRDSDTAADAFDRADGAMYKAKNGGRNKVISG
ncbi:MAG: GGDEF domain-containing protein [Pseudomonadota bacterium]